MGAKDLACVTVTRKARGLAGNNPAGHTVVWMRGEHDLANVGYLTQVIAETIAIDDEDVIIDLSGVVFMSAGTIAIFLRASAFLNSRARSLILRAPRPYALRLLSLCGLANLVRPQPGEAAQITAASEALRTWVAVPAVAPGRVVVSASTAADLVSETAEPEADAAADSPLAVVLPTNPE